MRAGLSDKSPRGQGGLWGKQMLQWDKNKCAVDTPSGGDGGSPYSSFILPSIYQCHTVNYCFIYLVNGVYPEYKLAPLLQRWKGKWLLSRLILPNHGVNEAGLNAVTHRLKVFFASLPIVPQFLMSVRLDHAVPGAACHIPSSRQHPCLWSRLEQDTRPDH